MPRHLFYRKPIVPILVSLNELIVEKDLAGTPSAGGLAFDGTNFFLNDNTNTKIYVYSTVGVLISTLNIARAYTDIEYDPYSDSLLCVGDAYTGIDRLSKSDGSIIETFDFGAYLSNEFTSIAIDRYYNRIYLMLATGINMYVLKAGTFELVRFTYFPFDWSAGGRIPATMIIALDGEDRSKIWVMNKSFPPTLGRININKIDEYRLLGAPFNQSKASISMRYVNNGWYFWGNMEDTMARLYKTLGMPLPVTVFVMPSEPTFDQDIFRWYSDDNAENPTPKANENINLVGTTLNEVLRLRLGLEEIGISTLEYTGLIRLQYSLDAITWIDVGEITDTDKIWRYYDGLGTDGNPVANLLLSTTTIKSYFTESYPNVPCLAFRNPDRGEFDFCITAYDIANLVDYYFRAMVYGNRISTLTEVPQVTAGLIPWERFKSWTEVDPDSKLTTEPYVNHFVGTRNHNAYLYWDYGIAFFTDFTHLLQINSPLSDVNLGQPERICALTYCNDLEAWDHNRSGNKTQVSCMARSGGAAGKFRIGLVETHAGATFFDETVDVDIATNFYLKLIKAGVNMSIEVYTDSARTVLFDTLTLVLQANHSFRYILSPQGLHVIGAWDIELDTSYLEL